MESAVIDDYKTSLDDLTFNSKPHINALTMLAEEYLPHAEHIVRLIEAQLNKAQPGSKLPLMYLMDSVVKNVGGNYTPLFAKNIVKSFYGTFESGDEKTKISLHKLRSTWDNYFPLRKLHDVDVLVHSVDPNWPIKPLPANLQEKATTSIHVNPKFLKKADAPSHGNTGSAFSPVAKTVAPVVGDSADLKQDLINKQKQLLDLQQQKLLLELEQTKQQLALREKRNQISAKKQFQKEGPMRDPRMKQGASSVAQPNFKVTLVNGQKVQAAANKDPRSLAASRQKKAAATTLPAMSGKKEVSEDEKMRAELLEAQKKSPKRAEAKSKSVVDSTTKTTSKKSPTNLTKKSGRTTSPKTLSASGKSDTGKKAKLLKKRGDVTSSKKLGPGKNQSKSTVKSPEISHTKGSPDHKLSSSVDSTKVKKRDRPPRRSPSHGSVPPAKQARRSTSVERRRSPSTPPRRRSDVTIPEIQEPAGLREVDQKRPRDPRRSPEESLSPRFSPEPDELPSSGKRQSWKPPVKRPRGPGPEWREEPSFRPALARRRSSIDPNVRIPQELTLSHQAEILKQAEIQLQTGQLTHDQHQELLKQLHQLFELQRLRNMQIIDPPIPTHQQSSPNDYPSHDHGGGMFLERRNSNDNRPDGMSVQSNNRNAAAFRPPPSPPQMEPAVDQEHFRPHPHLQRRSPERTHDPRLGRQPAILERLPHRGPRLRGPRPLRGDRGVSRPRNERLGVRGPPRGQRRGPRPDFQRRNSRDMEERLRNTGPPAQPQTFRDDGPYVYDDESFGRDMPPDNGGYFVRDRESPVREEPFLSELHKRRSPERHAEREGLRQKADEVIVSHKDAKKLALALRVYASPDVSAQPVGSPHREMKPGKRRGRTPPERAGNRKPGRHSQQNSPKRRKDSQLGGSDNDEKGHILEEPEDYIIASIPPEAEMYHQHSMTLKRRQSDADRAYTEHKKNILLSTYTKKLASEEASDSKDEISGPDPMSDTPTNAEDMSLPSPDMGKKDKIEEEVNKSPSLPLKKRKYLVSASEFPVAEMRNDSSDGGVMAESEPETVEAKKLDTAEGESKSTDDTTPVDGDGQKSTDGLAPVDGDGQKSTDGIAPVTGDGQKSTDGIAPVTGDEQKSTDGTSAKPEDEPSKLPDPADAPTTDEKEALVDATKESAEPNKESQVETPDTAPEKAEGKVLGTSAHKEDHDKDQTAEAEQGKTTKKRSAPKTMVKQDKKETRAKLKNKEKGRMRERGKAVQRPRNAASHITAKMEEEERLQSLMREEERILEWEAELQKQLEIQDLERELDRRDSRRPPDVGSLPRRGRRGADKGAWDRRRGRGRYPGGRGGPGREGWGRIPDEPFWDEKMEDPEVFASRVGPVDEGPPFPGRLHPDRPHDRLLPLPHERQAIMRERRDMERGWLGPPHMERPRSRRGGRDFGRSWNEGDMDRPPMPGGVGPSGMDHARPGSRFRGLHPPYNPDERMPHAPAMPGGPHFSEGSPRREAEPYAPFDAAPAGQAKPQEEMNQVNVNKLLADLLTMGIIPGNKPATGERPASGPPSRNNSPGPMTAESLLKAAKQPQRADSPAQPGTSGDLPTNKPKHMVEETRRVPTPVFHEEDLMALDPDANIPEITLADVDKLKIRCDELIKRLYTGIQCSACGMRFTACQTDVYAEHLDWHYRINRKDRDGIKETHRSLFPTAGDWIMHEEIVDPSHRAHNQVFDETDGDGEPAEGPMEPENPEDLAVPVKGRDGEDKCAVCGEAFKTVYNDEDDEWQYVCCVTVDEKNFHPSCYADHNDGDGNELAPLPTPVRVPLYNPIEQSLKGIPGLDSLNDDKSASDKEAEPLPEQNPDATDEAQPAPEEAKAEAESDLPAPSGDVEEEGTDDAPLIEPVRESAEDDVVTTGMTSNTDEDVKEGRLPETDTFDAPGAPLLAIETENMNTEVIESEKGGASEALTELPTCDNTSGDTPSHADSSTLPADVGPTSSTESTPEGVDASGTDPTTDGVQSPEVVTGPFVNLKSPAEQEPDVSTQDDVEQMQEPKGEPELPQDEGDSADAGDA